MSEQNKEKRTWKRDELIADQERVQESWETTPMKWFSDNTDKMQKVGAGELYTFPYPYSNGELHLGHGFTAVFYDVMARYARVRGVPVAQSFSYHLTGMPIVAAADRLRMEFESYDAGNHTALSSTADGKITQYLTMIMMGIPEERIRNFVDPNYWADYFPTVSRNVVKKFGIASNDSKSFITTEKSPYYDAFAKWHFSKLFEKSHLVFGKRHSIFSIRDNQPCLGHERSEGEDVVPAKFSLIKFGLIKSSIKDSNESFCSEYGIQELEPVYLIGLTMRPETLEGVTNVWIDPNHNYKMYRFGFYDEELMDTEKYRIEYWIMQEKNRLNLEYQYGKNNNPFHSDSPYFKDCGDVKGSTFVDSNVDWNGVIPVWAMDFNSSNIYADIRKTKSKVLAKYLTINTNKGTGIVGSVPSDSPIDYLGYMYKKCYEYGVELEEWSSVSDAIKPIINIDHPNYSGNRVARDLIESKLVHTPKSNMPYIMDDAMTEVKEFCYFTSIPNQSMINNRFAGLSMAQVRNTIEEGGTQISKSIVVYYEPDSRAVSRSGEELIVALVDQWFIDYSDPDWKRISHKHVDQMEFYDSKAEDRIRYAIDWLEQWPCSRGYGLGTRIPLEIIRSADPSITSESECPLIDSLSDSTIYMCLYTIYDLMQKFDPSEFTYDVFDYIFLLKNQDNPAFEKYSELRQNFLTYYPMDLRVSAKDLVNNHLAMCIMNHMAVWDKEFIQRYNTFSGKDIESFGPRAFRINGYIMVAKKDKSKGKSKEKSKLVEKMSKSKGNFKTLNEAIDAYGADPLRFTFCSASVGMDDAYFDQDLATRTVEKLHKEKEFILSYIEKVYADVEDKDLQNKELDLENFDSNRSRLISELIMNELSRIVERTLEAYARTDIRSVIQMSYHELLNLRDTCVKLFGYKECTHHQNQELIMTIFMTFVTLMYPVIPHFCEMIHSNPNYRYLVAKMVIKKIDTESVMLDECYEYLISSVRSQDNSSELKFRYDYATSLASDISSKVAALNRRKKTPNNIRVYCLKPGKNLNSDSEMAFDIMDELGFPNSDSSVVEIQNNILIPIITRRLTPIGSTGSKTNIDKKRMGEVLREYRRIEEFCTLYGTDVFNRLRTDLSTFEILNSLLLQFLAQTEVKQDITIVELSESDLENKVTDLKFCLPYVRYEN